MNTSTSDKIIFTWLNLGEILPGNFTIANKTSSSQVTFAQPNEICNFNFNMTPVAIVSSYEIVIYIQVKFPTVIPVSNSSDVPR